MKVPAVILAGGRSSRMGGRDKCLLPLRAQSILHRIIGALAPQVDRIAINSNGDPARFRGTGLAVIADIMPGRLGPLAGILTAMRWAEKMGADTVITVPCDTPFLPDDLVCRLGKRANGGIVVAASGGRTHPTAGLWPVHYADRLGRDLQSGTRRVTAWLEAADFSIVEYSFVSDDPFWNINTPAEWERARQMASSLALSRSAIAAPA